MRRLTVSTAIFAALLLAGCSGGDGADIDCEKDELYDPHEERCVRHNVERDTDPPDAQSVDDASDGGDESDDDAGRTDGGEDVDGSTDAGDVEPDVVPEECDKDDDGALAEECGGNDCDDDDPHRAPHLTEVCDDIDNNCSGAVNDHLDCTFYAHSGDTLYEIDPFDESLEAVDEGLPNLLDIDTHPDGTLFGITFDGLYRFDPWADEWVRQGDFGISVDDPNGLAIDSAGTAFVTSEDSIFELELETGAASQVGRTGDFYSSGDCVVDKRDTLYMTSKESDEDDKLVEISRENGQGEAIGETGFDNIFGLTSAWGTLYGTTAAGELIEIDKFDGEASLVTTFSDVVFYGAASTPNR